MIPEVPWIDLTGGHEPRGYHAVIGGTLDVIPHNPFEWLLELVSIALIHREAYLFNRLSFSCSRQNRHRVRNFDETARDRARHLRRFLEDDLETGRKSYRLAPSAGALRVSSRVLDIHGLDKRILERLAAAMQPHGLVTGLPLDVSNQALGLIQTTTSVLDCR